MANNAVLKRADIPTMFTLNRQRCMGWLGHVCRMEDGRFPKDLLYGELVTGKRPTGRPQLRYKDICKAERKALGIDTNTWEAAAADRFTWKQELKRGLSQCEENLTQQAEQKRSRWKTQPHADRPATTFTCGKCHRECHTPASVPSATPDDAETDEHSAAQNSMVFRDQRKPTTNGRTLTIVNNDMTVGPCQ